MNDTNVKKLPFEAIKVIESSPSRLVILDPPNLTFGVWLLFLAAVALGIAILVASSTGLRFAAFPLLFTLLLAVLGLSLATSKATYTLSREDGLLHIQRYSWGMKKKETLYRLGDIRYVTVETIKYAHILTVILNSGESFNLGNGSNRQGYYGAAEAINNFLGVQRQQ
jgi:hypothetical protein